MMDFPNKEGIMKQLPPGVLIRPLSFILRTCQAQMAAPSLHHNRSRCPHAALLPPNPISTSPRLVPDIFQRREARDESTARTLCYHIQPYLLKLFVSPGRSGWEEASGGTAVAKAQAFLPPYPAVQCVACKNNVLD